MKFQFAQQIQPLNGRVVTEFRAGIDREFRHWAQSDREQFPQAESQIAADECLVVDRAIGDVFAVDLDEALENGLPVSTIEVAEGHRVRTECF